MKLYFLVEHTPIIFHLYIKKYFLQYSDLFGYISVTLYKHLCFYHW